MALTEPKDVTTSDYLTAAEWNNMKSLLFDAIGSQEFTEQNYITNDESVTASLDALDQQAKDNADEIAANDTWVKGLALVGLIRGLEVSYKDADEVYVSGGVIHVYDGSNHNLLEADSQLTKAITGHGQTSVPIYFYVDTPDSGATLTADDIEWSATAPTYDHAKKGYYHPSNTDWRFIGSIPVDSSGNLRAGYRSEDGHRYEFDIGWLLESGHQGTSWSDIDNTGERVPHIDNAIARVWIDLDADAGGQRWGYVRKNGSSGTGRTAITAEASGDAHIIEDIFVDSNGLAEWKISNSAANLDCTLIGYWEPR